MSLKVFHLVFILASALLCGGFAWWSHGVGSQTFGSSGILVVLLSASTAGALLIYFIRAINLQVRP